MTPLPCGHTSADVVMAWISIGGGKEDLSVACGRCGYLIRDGRSEAVKRDNPAPPHHRVVGP